MKLLFENVYYLLKLDFVDDNSNNNKHTKLKFNVYLVEDDEFFIVSHVSRNYYGNLIIQCLNTFNSCGTFFFLLLSFYRWSSIK